MRRLTVVSAALAALLALTVMGPASAGLRPFPDRIDLPNGFAPEGIATGRGSTFYAGSRIGQGIWRGDYRTGAGSLLVVDAGPFTGMKGDAFDQLWVAGAGSGTGHVFDATTGTAIATFPFASAPTFVNDVVVTNEAAWFTDSFKPVLYRVEIGPGGMPGDWRTVNLTGQIAFQPNAFNLNGIEASSDGSTLLVINSTTGQLYAVDTATEMASLVDTGQATFTNGDGILLAGQLLYVVQNADNQVSVIRMNADFSEGTAVGTIVPTGVDTPTTAARFGSAIYLVNARFGATPGSSEPYWVTRADR